MRGWSRVCLAKLLILAAFFMPVWLPVLLGKVMGTPPTAPERGEIAGYELQDQASGALENGPLAGVDEPRSGELGLLTVNERITSSSFRRIFRNHEPATRILGLSSKSSNETILIAAPSMSGRLHAPNAYLLARAPYKVNQNWMPLHAVAGHLRYQLDIDQFNGREEVWLTSMQAWSRGRGDCEDHAILLADWLIDLGLDARVVLGKHAREGHAWVVVLKDGKEYLLEATSKRKLKRWSAYPLASMLPEYHPEIMFNRDVLWVNSGSIFTVDYSGLKWKQIMQFVSA